MPTYYTSTSATSATSYPYTGTYWTTSTTTDCSGFTWNGHVKKSEVEYLKHWIDSLKEPQISEDDILKLIEGDE